jgi:hypothetical protein
VPIALGALVACSSSSGSGTSCPSTSSLCTGKGKCMVVCPSTSETDISADFASVGTGDTIVFEPTSSTCSSRSAWRTT